MPNQEQLTGYIRHALGLIAGAAVAAVAQDDFHVLRDGLHFLPPGLQIIVGGMLASAVVAWSHRSNATPPPAPLAPLEPKA